MRYAPIVKNFPHMLHGGDYNPDQWLNYPEVIDEDFRLAKLAGVNSLSVGIFAWVALEPEEGKFRFDWLDRVMDKMAQNNMKAVLATPTGAKPHWMAVKYPEIRRVRPDGIRELQSGRHNHCFTSPVYREKTTIINSKLAERYAEHPALGVWHLSNEYGGECYCNLCRRAFREWLQRKYKTLENLNACWWSGFWSHNITDWEQLEQIAIEGTVTAMRLDWRRFVSDQTADFIRNEMEPLRKFTPDTPVTTNFMGTFFQLDYRRLAKELDVIAWDWYPAYHDRPKLDELAADMSFVHDLNRSMGGGKPFMLMESTPSVTNWMPVNKLLRPNVHKLKCLQAIAHGADTIQYFQWRKGRGGCEKFHGAVVDHVGHENTRVFREVAAIGEMLKKLDDVVGCATPAEVAIIYDWENRWILEDSPGPRKNMHEDWVFDNYRSFWKRGVPVDVPGAGDDFSKYKLLVAPMLYMLRDGVAERLTEFVNNGGTLVATFLTGIADGTDLVFRNGFPGPLRELFGVWAEEIDYLYDDESNRMLVRKESAPTELDAEYTTYKACDLLHAEGAEVLAVYGDDFYAGRPCLTVNKSSGGKAYYIGTRTEQKFLDDFYGHLTGELGLKRALDTDLLDGVTAQFRTDGKHDYVFLLNFTRSEQAVSIGDVPLMDVLTGEEERGEIKLEPYGSRVLAR